MFRTVLHFTAAGVVTATTGQPSWSGWCASLIYGYLCNHFFSCRLWHVRNIAQDQRLASCHTMYNAWQMCRNIIKILNTVQSSWQFQFKLAPWQRTFAKKRPLGATATHLPRCKLRCKCTVGLYCTFMDVSYIDDLDSCEVYNNLVPVPSMAATW